MSIPSPRIKPALPALFYFVFMLTRHLEPLALLEVRQYIVVRPSLVAQGRPDIVVELVAARVYHVVERARATEALAPWPGALVVLHAEAGARLRLDLVAPVVIGQLEEADEHGDLVENALGASGLHEEDSPFRILGEAIGDDRAARASAYDDKVVGTVGGRLGHDVIVHLVVAPEDVQYGLSRTGCQERQE